MISISILNWMLESNGIESEVGCVSRMESNLKLDARIEWRRIGSWTESNGIESELPAPSTPTSLSLKLDAEAKTMPQANSMSKSIQIANFPPSSLLEADTLPKTNEFDCWHIVIDGDEREFHWRRKGIPMATTENERLDAKWEIERERGSLRGSCCNF